MENNNLSPNNKTNLNSNNHPEILHDHDRSYKTKAQIEEIKESLIKVPDERNCIFICLSVGIVLSVVLIILGVILNLKTTTLLGYGLIIFGGISLATFTYGYFANYYYLNLVREELKKDNFDPEVLDQSIARNMFNLFLFLTMFLFIMFILSAFISFACQDKIKFYIKAISTDKEKWIEIFGNLSYNTVMNKFEGVAIAGGILSLIFSCFLGIFLYYLFSILGVYRAWQTVIQFFCLIFFIIGCLLLYFSVYLFKYREVSQIEKAVPIWLPPVLITLAVISIILSILGFIGGNLEKKELLNPFMWSCIAFSALIVICAISFFTFSGKFQELFENKCYALMDIINQDYLIKYIECENKYVFTTDKFEDIACPKNRIANFWEINLNKNIEDHKDSYGCLNKSCCYTFYNFIKEHIDYVGISALLLMIVTVFQIIGSYYMTKQLEEGHEIESNNKKTIYGSIIIAIIILIVLTILLANVPSSPNTSPTSNIKIEKEPLKNTVLPEQSILIVSPDIDSEIKNNEDIDEESKKEKEEAMIKIENERKLQENIIKNEVKSETVIEENKKECKDNCLKVKYTYKLSSNDGSFKLSPKFEELNLKLNEGSEVDNHGRLKSLSFNTDINIESFTDVLEYEPYCRLKKNYIDLRVDAEAYNPNSKERTTNSNNNNNETGSLIQLSSKKSKFKKFKTFNILNNIETKQEEDNNKAVKTVVATETTIYNNNLNDNNSINTDNSKDFEMNKNEKLSSEEVEIKVLDLSKLKEGEKINIYNNKKLQFSYISNNNITVNGLIKNEKGDNIEDVMIKISCVDYDSCFNKHITLTDKKYFSLDKFPVLKNNGYIIYNIEVSHKDYNTYYSRFITGGFAPSNIELGSIVLISEKIQRQMREEEEEQQNTKEQEENIQSNEDSNNIETEEQSNSVIDKKEQNSINEESANNEESKELSSETSENTDITSEDNSSINKDNVNSNTETLDTKSDSLNEEKNDDNKDETKEIKLNTDISNLNKQDNHEKNLSEEKLVIKTDKEGKDTVEAFFQVKSRILNAVSNTPVEDVIVEVYKGIKILTQQLISTAAIKYYEDEEEKKAKLAVSSKSYTSLDFLQKKISLLKNIKKQDDKSINHFKSNNPLQYIRTDKNGYFTAKNLLPGEYTFVFKHDKFHTNSLKLIVSKNKNTQIPLIGISPILKDKALRLVLTWGNRPLDLDIHSIFQIDKKEECNMFFGLKDCVGSTIDADNNNGGNNGVETFTIERLGRFIYILSVNNYNDVSEGRVQGEWDPELDKLEEQEKEIYGKNYNKHKHYETYYTPLNKSEAFINVYSPHYQLPILTVNIPSKIDESNILDDKLEDNNTIFKWWNVFCLDGRKGLSSLTVINKFSKNKPSEYNVCESIYNKSK